MPSKWSLAACCWSTSGTYTSTLTRAWSRLTSAACAARSIAEARARSSTPFEARVTRCVRQSKVLRTSSFRLALVYAGITAVSFLVLFAVVFWSTARFMRHQIDDSVANEIDEILTDPLAGNEAGLTSVVRGLA